MGSLVNGCVILIFMAMLGQTGPKLEARGSRDVVILQVRPQPMWIDSVDNEAWCWRVGVCVEGLGSAP
jgi:hypothetical protein